MAQVIWTGPAVKDLDQIAGFIAAHNGDAANALVNRVVRHVAQLEQHPLSGPVIPELRGRSTIYRQIVEPPCRVFYRHDEGRVLILYIIRGEMQFSKEKFMRRSREA